MVKALKIFFSGTAGPISIKLGMWHRGHWPIMDCINHDLLVDLDLFYGKVNIGHVGLSMEKMENLVNEIL